MIGDRGGLRICGVLFELSIGAGPVLLPPGFELVWCMRLSGVLDDSGGSGDFGNQRPVAVFAQSEGSEMFA